MGTTFPPVVNSLHFILFFVQLSVLLRFNVHHEQVINKPCSKIFLWHLIPKKKGITISFRYTLLYQWFMFI
ncbi:MAG: hypothetical protein AXW14_09295 [Alteromonas sp. Nap_26]|nr:MAG: hypothetical protein AXW14_09295 [Alteromonas sp. Nap_26]